MKSNEQVYYSMEILKTLGYKPVFIEAKKVISFSSFGFDNFKEEHKNIIRVILDKNLAEFYYRSDTQFIYLKTFRKLKTLNVKKVSKREIGNKWSSRLPFAFPDYLYARCNKNGVINWEMTTVYQKRELEIYGNYNVV